MKATKGLPEVLQKMDKAASDLYSAAVSRVREPIEAFFNWLNEKTNIQRAYKCRSIAGLLVHVMGCFAVAFVSLIFNY